jgi:hypothetical protein
VFAKRELVRKRRMKRRLKAAASIVVALAAGTFLACQRGVETARQVIDAGRSAERDGHEAATNEDDATALVVKDAKPNAMVKYEGGARDAAVDVKEHRKGMPVPDNLLE